MFGGVWSVHVKISHPVVLLYAVSMVVALKFKEVLQINIQISCFRPTPLLTLWIVNTPECCVAVSVMLREERKHRRTEPTHDQLLESKSLSSLLHIRVYGSRNNSSPADLYLIIDKGITPAHLLLKFRYH